MDRAMVLVFILILASVTLHVFGNSFMAEQDSAALSSALNVFSSLAALLAVLLVYASVAEDEVKRKAWSFLSLGFALWVLGELAWMAQVVFFNNLVPYPSIADLFWILGYPFLFGGLMYRLNSIGFSQDKVTAVNILLLVVGIAFAAVLMLTMPKVFSLSAVHLDQTLNLVYSVGDLVLFVLAASVAFFFAAESVSLAGPNLSKAWIIFAVGFAIHAVYDVFFSFFISFDSYSSGSSFDFLYDVAYATIALGAFLLSDVSSRY